MIYVSNISAVWSRTIAIVTISLLQSYVAAISRFAEEDTIVNPEKDNIVDENFAGEDGQIRDGMKWFWDQLRWVWKGDLPDGVSAREALLSVVKSLINYALGIIWLVALIYLIYHGLMLLFKPWDDAQNESSRKAIKYAAIAIVGAGVAWFIVSIIFQVLGVTIDAAKF